MGHLEPLSNLLKQSARAVVLVGLVLLGSARAEDEKTPIAEYRSQRFVVRADLDAEKAQTLLTRMEKSLDFIANLCDKPSSQPIECYLVDNLRNWPAEAFDESCRKKITQGAGITLTEVVRVGDKKDSAKAVVYAFVGNGSPEHEAIHAYLGQEFGVRGPLWFAEGVAEVGQYAGWNTTANQTSANCRNWVAKFLRENPPPPLLELIHGPADTGDSWQAYSYRWALCHLLYHHPEYREAFAQLAKNIARDQKETFESTFGDSLSRIEFEYRMFCRNVERGYRVDLCVWDWDTPFRVGEPEQPITVEVAARRGWQASGLIIEAGKRYQITTHGKWQLGADRQTTAAGDDKGVGRLIGMVQYEQGASGTFEIGVGGRMTAQLDGKLYLRCQESMGALADNGGSIEVTFKPLEEDAPPADDKKPSADTK